MTIRLICVTRNGTGEKDSLLNVSEVGGVNEQTGDLRFYNLEELHEIAQKDDINVYITDILGNKLKVVAAISPTGKKYVRTTPNEDKVDDILKLSSCKTFK